MSVLNSCCFEFLSGSITGPIHHECHGEFLEVPVMVLHLVLLHVVLTYAGFSLLPLQYQCSDIFPSHLE